MSYVAPCFDAFNAICQCIARGPVQASLAIFANAGRLDAGPEGNAAMPTRNINLTPEQDAFVAEIVEAGEYQNASEAIRDALRALQQRRREDALKLKLLRSQVRAGAAALKRGDFIEIDETELEGYLDGLTAEAGNI